jgi:hypothetical protein
MSDPSPTGAKPVSDRFNFTPYSWALVSLIAFGWWPMLLVYLAAAFADLNGCTIDANGPVSCITMGADWGGMLYSATSLVGIFAFTMPTALILLVVWMAVLASSILIWRRRRSTIDISPAQVRWSYYLLTLAALLTLGYFTLTGRLPGMVILVVVFGGIFWVLSFLFALFGTIRKAMQSR